MESELSLMLTTVPVVVFQMLVSDDKLEAVEQPVLSLFCMNASQSVIISWWRSGPV